MALSSKLFCSCMLPSNLDKKIHTPHHFALSQEFCPFWVENRRKLFRPSFEGISFIDRRRIRTLAKTYMYFVVLKRSDYVCWFHLQYNPSKFSQLKMIPQILDWQLSNTICLHCAIAEKFRRSFRISNSWARTQQLFRPSS